MSPTYELTDTYTDDPVILLSFRKHILQDSPERLDPITEVLTPYINGDSLAVAKAIDTIPVSSQAYHSFSVYLMPAPYWEELESLKGYHWLANSEGCRVYFKYPENWEQCRRTRFVVVTTNPLTKTVE